MDIREIQNLIKFVSKSGATEVKLEMDDFQTLILDWYKWHTWKTFILATIYMLKSKWKREQTTDGRMKER